jgi:hypothetical protein
MQELVDDSVFTSAKYQPYRAPTEEDKKRVAFAKKQAAQTDIKEDTYGAACGALHIQPIWRIFVNLFIPK